MSEQEENTGSIFYLADGEALAVSNVSTISMYVSNKNDGGHRHQFYVTTTGGNEAHFENSDLWYGEEADDPGPTITLKQLAEDMTAVAKGSQQKYALCCCEPEEEEAETETEEGGGAKEL